MNDLNRTSRIGEGFFSFSRNDLFLKLILLFPITTLLQNYIDVLNKLVFFAVLVVLFWVQSVKKRPLLYLLGVSFFWLISMLFTPFAALMTNLNMAFYYIFMVFYFVVVLADKEQFWERMVRHRRYIYYIVLIYTLMVTVSIFLPSSYSQAESGGWGDQAYFTSISGSPNRVGPASVFIVVLITFLIQTGTSRLIALAALPQLYVFLMGGSRTYFVVGACVIVALYYVMIPNKRWFFLSLVPVGAIGLILVLNSNMMDKFAATFQQGLSKQEFWRRLTNTRSVFWVKQLEMFFDTPWYKQLLGNGINFTTYNYGLWAHSDFIEILCSYGYIGLANYIALMLYTFVSLLKTRKRHLFIKCVVVFAWFFNAFINFFYCYFCAMLCYPMLLLIVHHLDSKET